MSIDILEYPTQRVLPARQEPIAAVVIHTTGETDLDRILKFYTDPLGLQPHFLVEVTGTIRRIVKESLVAYHAKIEDDEARKYVLGYEGWSHYVWSGTSAFDFGSEYPGYREWRDKWVSGGKQSPIDLVTGRHPNACSIGIELQQPTDDLKTADIFLDVQYEQLASLLADIWQRQKIPLTHETVLGHYDVSPMRRCTVHGSWDPGQNFAWNRLWDLLRVTTPIS